MQTRTPSSPSSVSETLFNAESADSEAELEPQQPADSLIGQTLLDSYKVERVLGEGGMGRIYEASHTRLEQRRFAIKVLRPELVSSPHIRARFEREVEAVARITHPGILTVLDVGKTELGWPFMVSEYLSGLDLLAYLRRFGALPDERVVYMGCRIAEALEATHAQGVIHRDVKPSNVFLLGAFAPLVPEWDRVKLIDFGLSRIVGRDDQLTKAGIVMGTPAYMSPEQARADKTDQLTDVYGVGAVLYAAATGVPPFREETAQNTLLAVMSRDPVRPREVKSSISEGLELVIQRAMAKQPERRYASMSALRLALSNLEQGARPLSRRAGVSSAEGGLEGVRWRLIGLASAAVLLCAAALASIGSVFVASTALSLSTTEKGLLSVVLASVLGLLFASLRRFRRTTWKNTAQLADRLPRLRGPLLAGLVVYALASFGVRFGDEVLSRYPWGRALASSVQVGRVGWAAFLSLVGLFAAAVAMLHQSWWQPLPTRWRWVSGPVLALGMAAAVVAWTRPGSLGRNAEMAVRAGSSPNRGSVQPANTNDTAASQLRSAHDVVLGSGLSSVAAERAEATLPPTLGAVAPLTVRDAGARIPTREVLDLDLVGAEPEDADPARAASEPASGVDAEGQSVALAALTDEGRAAPGTSLLLAGNDARALAARITELASRPSSLIDALHSIEQLLGRAPEWSNDPSVRRVLRQAASVDGDASRIALELMSASMGSRGPDLLYDLMLQRPALAERAKHQLSRFRVRKLFSPALAIAYDLRFSPSCASRLWLLDRASEVGDQRSVNVLSELAGKHRRCDKPKSPCLGPCQREAVQFSRSIDIIVRRLRAAERAASVN